MLKQKERIYKFDREGLDQALADIRKEKQNKKNGIISLLILLALFGFGVVNKEYVILYFISKLPSVMVRSFM